jgi:hypothetical protein
VKETDVDPAGTIAEAGVVSSGLLSDNATVIPPAGAPVLRETVHVAEAPLLRLDGAHANEVRTAVAVPPVPATAAPVPFSRRLLPEGDAAMPLARPMATEEVPDVADKFTVPTTPFEMMFELRPEAMQVYAPEAGAQDNAFPAFVSAGPAATEIEATDAGGYVSVHWTAAGPLPDGELSVNDSDAAPPVNAPDDNDREPLCARELRIGNRHSRESAGRIEARAEKLVISSYQTGRGPSTRMRVTRSQNPVLFCKRLALLYYRDRAFTLYFSELYAAG